MRKRAIWRLQESIRHIARTSGYHTLHTARRNTTVEERCRRQTRNKIPSRTKSRQSCFPILICDLRSSRNSSLKPPKREIESLNKRTKYDCSMNGVVHGNYRVAILYIHLLDLTGNSCEKCNYRSMAGINLRPSDSGAAL